MSTKSFFGIIIILAAIAATSCTKVGNNQVVSEERTSGTYTGIATGGDFNVYLSPYYTSDIKVEAEENLLPYIITEVDNDDLVIKTHNHHPIHNNKSINIYIKTAGVSSLQLSGSGYLYADSLNTQSLDVSISGSGKMELNVISEAISGDVSGSGEMLIKGSAQKSDFSISGSGLIDASTVVHSSCNADISGSGDLYVAVSDLLDVSISGSGSVHYTGTPIVKASVSGSGKIVSEE